MAGAYAERVATPDLIRILSIDGGGIYGLTSAIWLRQLCEGNPRFLDGTDVALFAGCSSGAINSLLLARHERPRDAVLSGELERFWHEPGPFSNTDPMSMLMSRFGFAGRFSDHDFLDTLRSRFGDMKLGELKQDVHISTFNWTGGKKEKTRAAQDTQHWRPKFFSTCRERDPDLDASIVEVAYAAATPPMFRPMRGGLGDGASFNGNPVVSAIAEVVRDQTEAMQNAEHGERSDVVGNALERLAIISIGSGQVLPFYGKSDINLGLMFSFLPSNRAAGVLWPPMAYAVDPATEEAEFIAKQLIGEERCLRLNPATIAIPTVTASMLARNPLWRSWIINQIYAATAGPATQKAIRATLKFIAAEESWNQPPTASRKKG